MIIKIGNRHLGSLGYSTLFLISGNNMQKIYMAVESQEGIDPPVPVPEGKVLVIGMNSGKASYLPYDLNVLPIYEATLLVG